MTDAAPACRLYLLLPERIEAGLVDALDAALRAGDVACVLLPAAAAASAEAERLRDVAQGHGAAFLLEGDWQLARRLRADGVHIAGEEALYRAARAGLGADAIVGAGCGTSRHLAMVMGEAGADYVALAGGTAEHESGDADIVAWWAELFEVPCVAWEAASLAQARAWARAGADFVAVGDCVWRHPHSAADAVRELSVALRLAREAA